MKLLIVVRSMDNPKKFANGTLKFITRAGFDYRMYIPKELIKEYTLAFTDAVYNHRIYIEPDSIRVLKRDTFSSQVYKYIIDTARKKGYKLVLFLPDNIRKYPWKDTPNLDDQILKFCKLINQIRGEFGQTPQLQQVDAQELGVGAYMKRIK